MSNAAIVIDNLPEALKPFVNKEGFLEIAIRQRNKKFEAFQKFFINSLAETKEKESLERVVNILNKNTLRNKKNLKILKSVSKIGNINLLLNGLNLCATCAGFAIMFKKLDSLSDDINRQFNELKETIKKNEEIHADFEFNKVLSNHNNMLDCRKKQQPYSEDEMRELIDDEYNVLRMLIKLFQENVSTGHESLIFSIFALLSMLTVSIRFFDELYYQKYHKILTEPDIWHVSHPQWESVYKTLTSEWFIEKIQDYAMFETKMSTPEIDIYYLSLKEQVTDLLREIKDNQSLLLLFDNVELLHLLESSNSADVRKAIDQAFKEATEGKASQELQDVYNQALQQAGVA